MVGNLDQKHALVTDKGVGTEDYLGVVFVAQDGPLQYEKELLAEVETVYSGINYSSLKTGATFTIREGGSIVGNGKVL